MLNNILCSEKGRARKVSDENTNMVHGIPSIKEGKIKSLCQTRQFSSLHLTLSLLKGWFYPLRRSTSRMILMAKTLTLNSNINLSKEGRTHLVHLQCLQLANHPILLFSLTHTSHSFGPPSTGAQHPHQCI